ncbi:MAG TPA: extracellular solute-binding protein [Chloroflexota bacterium]|jgi:multiple sugar transport system substrate-binding protein
MSARGPIGRRRFLGRSIAAGAGALLIACAPAATPPTATPKPAEPGPTEPAAPTAGPTVAPGPTASDAAVPKPTEAPKPVDKPAATRPAEPTRPAGAAPAATAVPIREAAGRRYVLEVQHPHAGPNLGPRNQQFARFEELNPDIGVRGVWAANDLSTNQKLFTAVAAGTPPHVTWVDGPQVAEWAARGVLADLTVRFMNDRITQDDFWTPSWKQNVWRGKIYAMSHSSDANFGFFWNKTIFEQAGLDPEKPPTTIDQMDEFHQRITRVEGNNIVRMGTIPWTVYGLPNSFFTWGWVWGAQFYDEMSEKLTTNEPLAVRTLDWMVEKYARKHDVSRVLAFQTGFGDENPFFAGKTAMAPFGPWEIGEIKRFAPNLKYGIAFLPAGPPPAQPRSSWVGGWSIGLPTGGKLQDQAWTFLHWFGATPEGAQILGQTQSNFSGFKKNPWLETAAKDRDLAQFVEILKEARHQRPVQPAQGFLMGEIARAVDDAIFGRRAAQEALDQATQNSQKELDKILKRVDG